LSIADDAVSFAANVVGVLLGALLGYLLGLRQQRKIDIERDVKRKNELVEALKAELRYLVGEITGTSAETSGFFGSVPFNFVSLDLPTFTSIVNSGQLLLLDPDTIRLLRELNTEMHEHNIAQAIFVGVGGSQNSTEISKNSDELKSLLENPQLEATSQFGGLLKVIMKKRKTIAEKAEELIRQLSKSPNS
jgi:hypothetical protein